METTTNWTTEACRALIGLVMTFDPQDGDGWRETIVATLFIVGVFTLMFIGKDVPEWLIGLIALVAGFYFGDKSRKHTSD